MNVIHVTQTPQYFNNPNLEIYSKRKCIKRLFQIRALTMNLTLEAIYFCRTQYEDF